MIELNKLYRTALENASLVRAFHKRYLYIRLKQRLTKEEKGKKPVLLVSGIRGVGKTTLLLQLFDELKNVFYFSGDSIFVKTSSLYAVVEEAYRNGYETIFIDEIHHYPKWVEEIKNIYDDFNLQVVASGSSTAAIKKGSLLLGRRAIDFPLNPLTFGEYFYLKEGKKYSSQIKDVLDKKATLRWLAEHREVEKYYREYLLTGGFPLEIEKKDSIFKLTKRMIYEDAVAEFNLTEKKVDVIERLLGFLSVSKLGEFSYTSFSLVSGYSKSTIYEAVNMLKELGLLTAIEEEGAKSKAKAIIKLVFSHSNLRAAFAEQLMQTADIGSLREEYFIFHMKNLGFPIFIPKKGKKNPDYKVKIGNKKILFEIGGGSKTRKQFGDEEGILMDDEKLVVLGFV